MEIRVGVVEQGTEKTRHYTALVEQAGARAVVLAWEGDPVRDAGAFEGFVLTGGDDPDARHFGEANHPAVTLVPEARDLYEIALLREVVAARKPLLAICRGAQMLNVALGGALEQHIPDLPGRAPHGDGRGHALDVLPGTLLERLGGRRGAVVNTYHHQGVGRLAPGLAVAARAEDGTIEALEGPGTFCLGVQWHPERPGNDEPLGPLLFHRLVEAARARRAAAGAGIPGSSRPAPPSKGGSGPAGPREDPTKAA